MNQGTIVLMGSGELTATMVEVHKGLLRRYGNAARAVFMDTPAGFQLNVDHISKKAVEYFQNRIQKSLEVASFKSAQDCNELEAEKAFGKLRKADYMLIGPGSPTYALEQLKQSPIPSLITQRIDAGGCLVAASAAALTVGQLTLPVYEIYKVGQPVHWVQGLDILGHFGLNLVVVPHWNNAEGGNHDTRFCFMGAPRLEQLEALLPPQAQILGLDEHTALIIDMNQQRATIQGIGSVTLRRKGEALVFTKEDEIPMGLLRGEARAILTQTGVSKRNESEQAREQTADPVWEGVHRLTGKIETHLDKNLVEQATSTLLELERHIWQARTKLEEIGGLGAAREIFREMLAHLGTHLAARPVNRTACVHPIVEALLDLRKHFKAQKNWAAADAIRDCLQQAKVVVEDTAEGAQWHIQP